jgi:ATP-dependent RNA helicase DDX42
MNFCLVGLIHGDMAQFDRTQVINEFKKRDIPILVATDVAGLFVAFSFIKFSISLNLISTWS